MTTITQTPDAIHIATTAVRLYAETHPRPPHVTQRQAAEMAEFQSRPSIRRWSGAESLTLNKFGLVPVSDIDNAIASGKTNGQITQPPAWSEAEIDLLKRIFPVSPDNVLAAAFQGRTIAAIKNQAAKRGLRRTDEYRAMRYQDRSAVMLSKQ